MRLLHRRVLPEVSVQVIWGTCGLMTVAHRHLVSPTGTCDCFRHLQQNRDSLTYCSCSAHLSSMSKNEYSKIRNPSFSFQFLRLFDNLTMSNLQTICSQTPPHDPAMFLAQVFQRLQQNRATASCAAGRRYPVQGAGTQGQDICRRTSSAPGEPSFERPQASWGPLPWPASASCSSTLDRRQWSTPGGSRRPLAR